MKSLQNTGKTASFKNKYITHNDVASYDTKNDFKKITIKYQTQQINQRWKMFSHTRDPICQFYCSNYPESVINLKKISDYIRKNIYIFLRNTIFSAQFKRFPMFPSVPIIEKRER